MGKKYTCLLKDTTTNLARIPREDTKYYTNSLDHKLCAPAAADVVVVVGVAVVTA